MTRLTNLDPSPDADTPPVPLINNRRQDVDNRPNARTIAKRERALRALQMRKEGYSFQEIGEELGLNPHYVSQMVIAELKKINKLSAETRDELVRMEVERCDSLLKALYPDRGQAKVTEVILKVMERKARLLGLDAPLKLEQAITVEDLTPEQQAEEARRIGLVLLASAEPQAIPLLSASGQGGIVSGLLPGETIAVPVSPSNHPAQEVQDADFEMNEKKDS